MMWRHQLKIRSPTTATVRCLLWFYVAPFFFGGGNRVCVCVCVCVCVRVHMHVWIVQEEVNRKKAYVKL